MDERERETEKVKLVETKGETQELLNFFLKMGVGRK